MRGKVSTYFVDRGYGFIVGEDGRDYFVSQAYILDQDGFRYLDRDEEVAFEPVKTVRGRQAHHVKRYEPEDEDRLAGKKWVPAKINPFTPQDPITDPMLFAGREEYVDIGLDAALNSQNVLVTGDRGVGKSSFSNQLLTIATGDFTLLDQLVIPNPEADLTRLAVAYTCEPGDDLKILAASIASSIVDAAGSREPSKTTTTFGVNKIVQAVHAIEFEDSQVPSVAAAFSDAVVQALRATNGDYDGVCVLIDEIDVLDEAVQLAPFLKAATETLQARNAGSVSFVVTGVSGNVTNLLRQHPSFARLFKNIHLDPMTERELKEVVLRALHDTDVNVHPKALEAIVQNSGHLPASVQLLGYYSYKDSVDGHIGTRDVENAIATVVRHIRKQFYRDLRDSVCERSKDMSAVLNVLATHASVNTLLLADTANIGEQVAAAALEDLRSIGVALLADKRYCLRDPLFGRFLRA